MVVKTVVEAQDVDKQEASKLKTEEKARSVSRYVQNSFTHLMMEI